MKADKTELELFDSYLAGDLDKNSMVEFEYRLTKDLNFKNDFDNYIIAVNIVKTAAVGKQIRSLTKRKTTWVQVSWYTINLSIAASILLFISFFMWSSDRYTNDVLFESYFQPYPGILTTRSEDKSLLEAALSKYNAGRYAETINLLEKVPSKNDTLYFYSGISNVCINENEKAIEYLIKIRNNSIFFQQARWYLGLTYLRNGDRNRAKEEFNKIRSQDFKYREAKLILASM